MKQNTTKADMYQSYHQNSFTHCVQSAELSFWKGCQNLPEAVEEGRSMQWSFNHPWGAMSCIPLCQMLPKAQRTWRLDILCIRTETMRIVFPFFFAVCFLKHGPNGQFSFIDNPFPWILARLENAKQHRTTFEAETG